MGGFIMEFVEALGIVVALAGIGRQTAEETSKVKEEDMDEAIEVVRKRFEIMAKIPSSPGPFIP